MPTWDDSSGDWQNLSGQLARYEALARIIRDLGLRSVLDIGCGEAWLRDALPPETLYLGIEPSRTAVVSAQVRASVVLSTAEDYNPASRWDCIVFNEVLYYSSRPRVLLDKYSSMLTGKGILLISIYQRPEPLLSRLRRRMTNARATRIVERFIRQTGAEVLIDRMVAGRWRIWAIRPR